MKIFVTKHFTSIQMFLRKMDVHPDFRDESALEVGKVMLQKDDFECFFHHPTKAAELATPGLHPLACVFIVAHDLLYFYEKTGNQFNIDDFIAQKKEKYSAGTFKKILTELARFKMG